MITRVIFLILALSAGALTAFGAARDSYHTPAIAVLLAATRALSICILAGLVLFWKWEKVLEIPTPVTGLILVDEMTPDKEGLAETALNLVETVQTGGGRPVLLTYNSLAGPVLTGDSHWQRFTRIEHTIPILNWLQDLYGALPTAVVSDRPPAGALAEWSGSQDISWIVPRGKAPQKENPKVKSPEQVFVNQSFEIRVTPAVGSKARQVTVELYGEIVRDLPIKPGNGSEPAISLDLTLEKEGYSLLDLKLFDGMGRILAKERRDVLALPKPGVVYISPFGTAAPLSKLLADNGFSLVHFPPGRISDSSDPLGSSLYKKNTLIIVDSVPLPLLSLAFTKRLAEALQRPGVTMLYIPGADVGVDFKGNPLEKLLPVKLGRPDDEEHDGGLAYVAIVDTSMSMFYTAGGSVGHGAFGPNPIGPVSKIQMAKKALENLSGAIGEENRFGILTVTDSPAWVLKPTEERNVSAEIDIISRIYALGPGINLYSGLLAASNELMSLDSGTRHILVFLDTADVDEYEILGRGTVWELLEGLRKHGITVSLIGFGKPDDVHIPQLNRFAEEAGGYFYLTSDLEEIPGFGLKDLEQVTGKLVTSRDEKVFFYSSDFTGSGSFPDVKGQVVTALKPGASLYAWTEGQLPLYAAWPYGKGDVGVFCADSGFYLARDWITGSGEEAWLALLSKLGRSRGSEPDVFYAGAPDGHRLFVRDIGMKNQETLTAQAFYSNGSTVTWNFEKTGLATYVSRIGDPASRIRSITLDRSKSPVRGSRALYPFDRTTTAGNVAMKDFVPRPNEDERPRSTPAPDEILRLLILLAVLFIVIDEFFRPPSMEEG